MDKKDKVFKEKRRKLIYATPKLIILGTLVKPVSSESRPGCSDICGDHHHGWHHHRP